VADFKERRENYLKVYEPVDNEDGPHVKIINSRQFIVTNIRGYLPLKVSSDLDEPQWFLLFVFEKQGENCIMLTNISSFHQK